MLPCLTISALGVSGIPFCGNANPPFDNRHYSRTRAPEVLHRSMVLLNIRCIFSRLSYGNECRLAVQGPLFSLNWTLFDTEYDSGIRG
jgi:hypothetical protein